MTIAELRELEHYPELEIYKAHADKTNHKKIIHRDYHRSYDLITYILLFFIFSCIGWLWEVFIYIVEDGILVNRGTLMGPWIPIYGSGGVLGLMLLKKISDKKVLTFLCVIAICSVVEYATSWQIERYKHVRYWDYSGYFANINGRVCLEGMLLFGLAGCAGIYILAPLFDDLLNKIPYKVRLAACVVLVLLFVTDIVYSRNHPHRGKGLTEFIMCIVPEKFSCTPLDKLF